MFHLERAARFYAAWSGIAWMWAVLCLTAGPAMSAPAVDAVDAGNLIEFDRGAPGRMGADRDFRSADPCDERRPCAITQHGALRFNVADEVHETRLFFFRGNVMLPIALFDKVPPRERGPLFRAFHRGRNYGVLNLDGSLEQLDDKDRQTLYLFGVQLQYALQNGDLLYISITDRADSRNVRRFYFRYFESGMRLQVNVTTILPWTRGASDATRDRLEAADISIAGSLSVYWNLDPGRRHSFGASLLSGIQPTVFAGVLSESLVDEGRIVRKADGFVGGGVTLFKFLSLGAGVNLFEAPRGVFPFGGVHVNELVQFFAELGKGRAKRWEQFRKQEM